MRLILALLIMICLSHNSGGQLISNYVKNGDFERYDSCPPSKYNQIRYAKYWYAVDTFALLDTHTRGGCIPEYCNACIGVKEFGIPDGWRYYQYAHSGTGMAHGYFFCDEVPPASAPYYIDRDYLQGRLYRKLTAGKSYCVSFYIVLSEGTTYATNKMGAYLDDGSIDTVSICSKITFVKPQMFTNKVMDDTMNWTKVEGTFTASGNETFITIGNFFPKDSVTFVFPFHMSHDQWAYYLIDDVSVVESDLPADAGVDRWVEATKTVQIGRFNDSTATVLDCKWYHKGVLIDSGATISVAANAAVGAKDTYVVVQTVCGLVKTDTVEVRTVPLGIEEWDAAHALSIFPNPSKGNISIQALRPITFIRVYDLSGRVQEYPLPQTSNQTNLHLAPGMYILEVQTDDGLKERKKVLVE